MLEGLLSRARRRARGKADLELDFWRGVRAQEGELAGAQFEGFLTTGFRLTADDFAGKRVLDVGCGPRGTLDWATMAAERVGVDPLVGAYRELGIDRHAMTYVEAPAEALPFPDGHFDVVATLNSLDHVDDVGSAIAEITRVTRPGGVCLLLVEIGHEPTPTEPQALGWDLLERFDGWRVHHSERFGLSADHNVYRSWFLAEPYVQDPGLLKARLERI